MKTVEKKCRQCSTLFSSPASHHRIFCSVACLNLSRKKYTDATGRECISCHKWKQAAEFSVVKNKYLNSYCKACSSARMRDHSTTPEGRFVFGKSLAKKREYEWLLSLDDYRAYLSMPCHYCGGPLSKMGCGLDRKDNSLGYINGNVVPCCGVCNMVKGENFTYQEMIEYLAPAIISVIHQRLESHSKKRIRILTEEGHDITVKEAIDF